MEKDFKLHHFRDAKTTLFHQRGEDNDVTCLYRSTPSSPHIHTHIHTHTRTHTFVYIKGQLRHYKSPLFCMKPFSCCISSIRLGFPLFLSLFWVIATSFFPQAEINCFIVLKRSPSLHRLFFGSLHLLSET